MVSLQRGPGPLSVTEQGRTSPRAVLPPHLPGLRERPLGQGPLVASGSPWDTLQRREKRPRAECVELGPTLDSAGRLGPLGMVPAEPRGEGGDT